MRRVIVLCMILAALLAMRLGVAAGTDAEALPRRFVDDRRIEHLDEAPGPGFRGTDADRKKFAAALADALVAYLKTHAAIDLAPVPAQ